MRVIVTLGEIASNGDWDTFCQEKGYSVYAVNEGGGDIDVTLTQEEAIRYGLLTATRAPRNFFDGLQF